LSTGYGCATYATDRVGVSLGLRGQSGFGARASLARTLDPSSLVGRKIAAHKSCMGKAGNAEATLRSSKRVELPFHR
jgi:hypothetical protein